jgi:hypothetical protein
MAGKAARGSTITHIPLHIKSAWSTCGGAKRHTVKRSLGALAVCTGRFDGRVRCLCIAHVTDSNRSQTIIKIFIAMIQKKAPTPNGAEAEASLSLG